MLPLALFANIPRKKNVSRLADVKNLYHQYKDGIQPSTLLTDEWRQMYLETVEMVSNEAALRDEEDQEFRIPVCHDLGLYQICRWSPRARLPPVGYRSFHTSIPSWDSKLCVQGQSGYPCTTIL